MLFLVELTLRFTRISCRPFGATKELSRIVRAGDRDDALRQACLCVDRDLEGILAFVNTINVSKIKVDVRAISALEADEQPPGDIWNPVPFDPEQQVPRYIVVRDV